MQVLNHLKIILNVAMTPEIKQYCILQCKAEKAVGAKIRRVMGLSVRDFYIEPSYFPH